jgi:hypothetical protein
MEAFSLIFLKSAPFGTASYFTLSGFIWGQACIHAYSLFGLSGFFGYFGSFGK